MIIDKLILQNFGAYKGSHEAVLTPDPSRPIVLIGALNGSGKTTFLEAMQLALYGRATGLRGRGSYPEYLARSINRYVSSNDGAGVTLAFRYWADGKLSPVRLVRTWHRAGKGIKESFEVWRDERFDSVATERWAEFVEEIIPHQIAHLFFFDGEKIEGLANPTQSAALLRVGIHSLLGLDLVDHLVKSLGVVERRSKAGQLATAEQEEIKLLDEEIATLDRQRLTIVQKIAEVATKVDQRTQEVQRLEKEFELAGGGLFERRNTLEADYERLKKERSKLFDEIGQQAAGDAPLLLVQSLATEMDEIVGGAIRGASASKFGELLESRDNEILMRLRELRIAKGSIEAMREFLAASRPNSNGESSLPSTLLPAANPAWPDTAKVREELERRVSQLRTLEELVAACERNLGAVPDEDAVAPIQEALIVARRELEKLRVRKSVLEEELGSQVTELTRRENQRRVKLEKAAETQMASAVKGRVVRHSVRARETLTRYRTVIAQRHMANLEQLISRSFAQLHRKKSLKYAIEINRETYELRLREASGHFVEASELSAGERQLLAVSVLWALAQASGRKLPTIIDTPLGRLDGPHRHFLVDNYFPFASHQVILLSTDEEVTPAYRRRLAPAIGREYSIVFNESERTSKIVDGYFAEALAA